MAIQTLPGGLWIPTPWPISNGAPSVVGRTLNAAGDRYAFIFPAPKAGTLDWFEWNCQTVTNNPDNGVRLSFQTPNASGDPDGTQSQFRDMTGVLTTGWKTPAGPLTSDGTDTGVKRTVTAGELLCCVIDFVTFVASDSFAPTVLSIPSGSLQPNQTFNDDATTGVYTKDNATAPVLALRYSDGTYGCFHYYPWPILTINTRTFASGSTPDERGLRFQLPARVACDGAWVRLDLDNACDVILYDANDTILASQSFTSATRVVASATTLFAQWTAVTLAANTTYRLAVLPTTVSSVSLYDFDLSSADLQACLPGGTSWYSTSRTDGGAWTDVQTNRPFMGLRLSGADDGVTSSGGLVFAPI